MILKIYFAGVEDPEELERKREEYAYQLKWGQEGKAEEYAAMCREYDMMKVNVDGHAIRDRYRRYEAAKDRRRVALEVIPLLSPAFRGVREEDGKACMPLGEMKQLAAALNVIDACAVAEDLHALWRRRKITLGEVADRLAPLIWWPGLTPDGLQHRAAEREAALRDGYAKSHYFAAFRDNGQTEAARAEFKALQYCGINMSRPLAVMDWMDEKRAEPLSLGAWNRRAAEREIARAAAAYHLPMDEWRLLYGD